MQPVNAPRLTFIVFSYNQEKYVHKAIWSALNQDYCNLEVIVSDDGSSDNTCNIIDDIAEQYRGPHHLVVRKSGVNKGLADNIKHAVACSTGDYIIMAAGDDISIKNRASFLASVIESTEHTAAIYTDYTTVEGDVVRGNLRLKKYMTVGPLVMALNCGGVGKGATYCFRRDVFETFDPLSDYIQSEDKILPFVAALIGKVYFVPVPTVYYRLPHDSLSTQLAKKKKLAIQDSRHLVKLKQITTSARYAGCCNIFVHRVVSIIFRVYYENSRVDGSDNSFFVWPWRALYYPFRTLLLLMSKVRRFQI